MGRNFEVDNFLLLLLMLFSTVMMIVGARATTQEKCLQEGTSWRANTGGVEIRYPFWLKDDDAVDHHPPPCSLGSPAGFGLSRSPTNHTRLQLDSVLPAKLLVESIDYADRTIRLVPADGCLAAQLIHLDLSTSPFQYAPPDDPEDFETNLAILRCPSTSANTGLVQFSSFYIDCLSDRDYKRYGVPSDYPLPQLPLQDCQKDTVSIHPVPYNQLAMYGADLVTLLRWPHNIINCHPKGAAAAKLKETGYILGPLLGALAGIVIYIALAKKKTEMDFVAKMKLFLEDYRALKPTRCSYADIKRITNQFKHKVGQGGYGSVFKGKLSNEVTVAVKILHNTRGDGQEFINEVKTIGTIHHVNVVRLLGFCADGYRRALVYEFLPNESLDKFIFSETIKKALGWKKLKDIALGTAKGIEYLHQGCEQRILHFDIKPHNVLLDHNLNPKISDFGLAKLCSKEQSAVSLTAARGTIGYIAPEVVSRNFGNVSHKSDVYSFGMLLVNMVEGGKNSEVTAENSSQEYFPDSIYSRLEREEVVGNGIDTAADANIAKQLVIVGLWCIQWHPVNRPTMKGVVQMLEGDGDKLTMPPNPFAPANPTGNDTTRRGKYHYTELPAISESD